MDNRRGAAAGRDPGAGGAGTARGPSSPRRPCARADRPDRRDGPARVHGSAAQLRTPRARFVAEHALEQLPQAGVVDLAREVLEKALELVQVAVGNGQERRRIGRGVLGARDGLHLELAARRESARRARVPARHRRARSGPPARRRRGRRARRWRRCGRAARAAGRACPRARAGAPCASRQRRRSPHRRNAEWRRWAPSARPPRERSHRSGRCRLRPSRSDGAVGQRRGASGSHRFMMYGESDAASDLGSSSGRAFALRRWSAPSRAGTTPGDAASAAVSFLGSSLERRALRADRPRGVLRLSVHASAHQAGRGPHARDQLAVGGDLRGARAPRAPGPRARPGRRALDALARVQLADRRPGRGARRPDHGHARSAARRRAPFTSGVRSPGWPPIPA